MIDKLNKLYRNTIRLTISGEGKHNISDTRFGGMPDVPGDFFGLLLKLQHMKITK